MSGHYGHYYSIAITQLSWEEELIEKNGVACSDDASSKLYDLANLTLEECKATSSLSDLDTAIYLFRKALDQRSAPHPMRSRSPKDLAEALLMRFCLTNHLEDLDRAISLYDEMVPELHDVVTGLREFQLDVRALHSISKVCAKFAIDRFICRTRYHIP